MQHFQQMLISQQKMNIAKLMSKYILFSPLNEFLVVPLEKKLGTVKDSSGKISHRMQLPLRKILHPIYLQYI